MGSIPLRQYALHTTDASSHQLAFWDALEASLTPEQRARYASDGELRALWEARSGEAVADPGRGSDAEAIQLARPLVQEFESLETESYPDPETGGSPWTIGWGSTQYDDGSPVLKGQRISRARADLLLNRRLERDAKLLAIRIPGWQERSSSQRAALLSFTYNCGIDWYGSSGFETISRAVREGRWDDVPAAMELYVNPGGPSEQGLRRRRKAEIALYRNTGRELEPAPAPAAKAAIERWRTRVEALKLSQPNASTCQAACIAMGVRDPDIMGVRRKLLALGTAGDPAVMGRVIKGYGVPYVYNGDARLSDVYRWLRDGELLITHGWFTASGHVIVLDGLAHDSRSGRYLLDVADPWSEFDAPLWKYASGAKFYDGTYSELCIYAACVAGTSAGNARDIYKAGQVDRNRGGMWVHRILPR